MHFINHNYIYINQEGKFAISKNREVLQVLLHSEKVKNSFLGENVIVLLRMTQPLGHEREGSKLKLMRERLKKNKLLYVIKQYSYFKLFLGSLRE